jgi:hypothetical protein
MTPHHKKNWKKQWSSIPKNQNIEGWNWKKNNKKSLKKSTNKTKEGCQNPRVGSCKYDNPI